MNKIALFIIVALFSFTFFTTNAQAKLTSEEETFIKTITTDFVKTHSLNLNEYSLLDIRELHNKNKENLQAKEKSLLNISFEITKNQSFVDCSPIFYIDNSKRKGYVLEKKLSGMNNLSILSYDESNNNWIVTNKNNIMGTDLVDLGLLKGNE
jgi:hypothetical protein